MWDLKGTKGDRKWEKTETNLWQFRSVDGNPCWFFWNLQKYTCNVYWNYINHTHHKSMYSIHLDIPLMRSIVWYKTLRNTLTFVAACFLLSVSLLGVRTCGLIHYQKLICYGSQFKFKLTVILNTSYMFLHCILRNYSARHTISR